MQISLLASQIAKSVLGTLLAFGSGIRGGYVTVFCNDFQADGLGGLVFQTMLKGMSAH